MQPTVTRPDARLEQKVTAFLQEKGLRLVEQHFLCALGHLDLIMQSEETLVFVEVAYRREHLKGSLPPYFRPSKQAQIQAAAEQFRRWRPWTAHLPYRFDVVVVCGPTESPKHIAWHKEVFQGYNTGLTEQEE